VQVRHASARPARPARHRLKVVRHRAAKVVATGVVATMLAAFVAVGERIHQLEDNMHVVEIKSFILDHNRPSQRASTAEAAPLDPFGGRALNILITGIDTRSGENAYIAEDSMDTLLNDVNMVAHISADRSRVDIMAIPRDTLVPLPACELPSGGTSGAQSEAMINQTFAKGAGSDPEQKAAGMACAFRAIEEITNIPLDGFVLVEFAGFTNVVDALGGVDICLPDGLIGTKTHLELEPGMHHLEGAEALQFARTRYAKTWDGKSLDGSDLVRINRQQQLMATVINEVLASGGLASLPKLNATATAVTRSLYVSPELASVPTLAGLAYALRDIEMANVSLFMIPVTSAGQRVRLSAWGSGGRFGGLGAEEIFELMATDQPIPGTTPYKVAHAQTDTASPAPPEATNPGSPLTASPDDAVSPDPAPPASAAPPAADEDFVTPLTAPVTCEVAGQGD
jgi:LCP family protein required for cell wall assembly